MRRACSPPKSLIKWVIWALWGSDFLSMYFQSDPFGVWDALWVEEELG